MAAGVQWVIELVDRVSARAAQIDRVLARVESGMNRVNRASNALNSRLASASAAGESSASRIERSWNNAARGLNNFQGGLRGIRASMMDLASIALPAAAAGYAGKQILDAAGQRESNLINMGLLLRTKDQNLVKQSTAWVDRFADITPFKDQDVWRSVRQSMGYGFSFEETKGLVRVVGDVASGASNDPAEAAFRSYSIVRALGQIKGAGKLMQQEVNQLVQAGVQAPAYLKAAFGPNYKKLQQQGKISAASAIKVLLEGIDEQYGGTMMVQSQTLFSTSSTLLSRVQRLFGRLYDPGGLTDLKRLFTNLINISDFEKGPGKRIMDRFMSSGTKLTKAFFGPLADATQGEAAERNVDRLLDKLDQFSDWLTTHGPRIGKEIRGFGEGLKAAGDGAMTLLRPLIWIGERIDRMSGGTGEGVIGKILGFTAGALILGRLANVLSFGGLTMLGRSAGRLLLGGLRIGMNALSTRGLLGEILTNPAGKLAGLRAAMARMMTWSGSAFVATMGTRLASLASRFPTLLGGAGRRGANRRLARTGRQDRGRVDDRLLAGRRAVQVMEPVRRPVGPRQGVHSGHQQLQNLPGHRNGGLRRQHAVSDRRQRHEPPPGHQGRRPDAGDEFRERGGSQQAQRRLGRHRPDSVHAQHGT
ncbi:tape measure protein [Deinococcus arenicola]|uniref:Tape measure protein n=1 Tax=Deinococcus arenicola TaxID=2994950 RepID=A0ABU4DVA1_9DEIO|nr:tape measure protein [Deinococcus sp. ZS9-10]MDV6376367.1 tape measure protein [Deinococcus sp. ZS9-10]